MTSSKTRGSLENFSFNQKTKLVAISTYNGTNADKIVKHVVATHGGYVASKPCGAGVVEIMDTFAV